MEQLLRICKILDSQTIHHNKTYHNLFLSLHNNLYIIKQNNPIKLLTDLKYIFFELLEYLFQNQATSAPLLVIKMYAAVKYTRYKNEIADIELQSYSLLLEDAINTIFSFSSLESEDMNGKMNLYRVLLPDENFIQKDHENIKMIVLQENRLINYCIDLNLKAVFKNLNITLLLQETFYECSKKLSKYNNSKVNGSKFNNSSIDDIDLKNGYFYDENARNSIYFLLENLRYCPAFMFLFRLTSHIVILILTNAVLTEFSAAEEIRLIIESSNYYGSSDSPTVFPTSYPTIFPTSNPTSSPSSSPTFYPTRSNMPSQYPTFQSTFFPTIPMFSTIVLTNTLEISLNIYVIGSLLYSLGKLKALKWNFRRYYRNLWNRIESISIFLLLWWYITQICNKLFDWWGNIALALSAVPQAINLLQYVCINKRLGISCV